MINDEYKLKMQDKIISQSRNVVLTQCISLFLTGIAEKRYENIPK